LTVACHSRQGRNQIMQIVKVEIEVVNMTYEEENALWFAWTEHFKNKGDVFVCGHKLLDWNTNDGNDTLLISRNGTKRWFEIVKEK
jgi:hypothetical protein